MSLFLKNRSMFKITLATLLCFIVLPAYGMMGRLRIVAGSFQKAVSAKAPALQQIPRATKAQILVAGGCSVAAAGCLAAHATVQKEAHDEIAWKQWLATLLPTPEKRLPSDDSITIMYLDEGDIPLYIPKEKFPLYKNNPLELKKLFEKYKIIATSNMICLSPLEAWQEKDWVKASKIIKERKKATTEFFPLYLSIDQVPQLLEDAKAILRSFIPAHEIDQAKIKENFIEKGGINRLFTYAKLQHVIQKKELSHIHLPKKLLVIKDRETGKYITGETASRLLDDLIQIYSMSPSKVTIRTAYIWDRYYLCILAEKQPRISKPFSYEALEELKELVKETPFDIGDDNIFRNDNGDTVIIDTEWRGADTDYCLEKFRHFLHG